jgi:MobA/VirD2-like, nuclease domain
MIPSVSDPGSGFRGTLDYDLKPSKQAELLGGPMRAQTARGLAQEFGDWRALNEAVTKPVFHCSLAAAPEDHLTAERWLELAGVFTAAMGYENSPWIAIRHHDRAIDHIHIVASRIDNQGRYVPNHLEKKRSQEICREIEKDFGLRQLRSRSPRAAPTRNDIAVFERTGLVTVKARLQEHVDLAARDRPTMSQFVERLEAQGVEVRANLAATDRVAGVSFAYDGVAFKGSDLGRGYSWLQLQKRAGIGYSPARDLPVLRAAADRATTCIAARKPLVRDPEAPPMPPLERPAEAFRQAVVVESRADVEERRGQLLDELGAARAATAAAWRRSEEGPSLERAVAAHRLGLERQLERIYQDPEAAWNRLSDMLAREGLDRAAAALERHPADLGHVHGHALGRLETQARRGALAAAPHAGRKLRDLVAAAGALATHRAQAAAVAETRFAGEQRAEEIAAGLGRLPDLEPLRRDLLRAGRALGAATVNALSARAVRVFAAASRLLGRAIGHDLTQDRGFGRGDDGLGR